MAGVGDAMPRPAGSSSPGALRVAPSGPAAGSGRPFQPGNAERASPPLADEPPVRHRTCQWIDGDPLAGPWHYCGAPTASGSYCAEHYLRSYAPRVREAA